MEYSIFKIKVKDGQNKKKKKRLCITYTTTTVNVKPIVVFLKVIIEGGLLNKRRCLLL